MGFGTSVEPGVCDVCGKSGNVSRASPVATIGGDKIKAWYAFCNDSNNSIDGLDASVWGLNGTVVIFIEKSNYTANTSYNHMVWWNEKETSTVTTTIPGTTQTLTEGVCNGQYCKPGVGHYHVHCQPNAAVIGRHLAGTSRYEYNICSSCAQKVYDGDVKEYPISSQLLLHDSYYGIAPIKYKVRYNANGGSGSMSDSEFHYQGGNSTVDFSLNYYIFDVYKLRKNTFTRSGYEFIGWNTKSDGTGDWYLDEGTVRNMSSTDGDIVTVYAQWSKQPYKITFDTQGGSYSYTGTNNVLLCQKNNGYMISYSGDSDRWLGDGTYWYNFIADTDWSDAHNYTEHTYVLEANKPGSIFRGWYTSEGVRVFDEHGRCLIKNVLYANYFTADTVLYAHYSGTVKIRFDTQGGTYGATSHQIDSYQRDNGYLISCSGDPSKWLGTGTSWYSEFNEGNDWNNTNNRTIARCVMYPQKSGSYFTGWYTSGGTKVFDYRGRCVIKSVMTADYFTTDITLYAHFSKEITITFNTQGGEYDYSGNHSILEYQKDHGVLYSVVGHATYWLGVNSYNSSEIMWYNEFTEDKWDSTHGYTVHTYVLPVRLDGHDFKGWFTAPTGGTQVFDEYGKCLIKSVTKSEYFNSNTTLYAQFTKHIKINVEGYGCIYGYLDKTKNNRYYFSKYLQENGYFCQTRRDGIFVEVMPLRYSFNSWDNTAGRSAAPVFYTPTREGYIYGGIFTQPNGQGEQLFEAGTGYCICRDLIMGTKFSSDTTIYTYWIPIEFDITWDYNKPTESSSDLVCNPKPDKTTVEYVTSKWSGVAYPSPSIVGWKFLGWYRGNTRYDTRTDDITIDQRVDITLTAKWERIEYGIMYKKGGSDK